MARVRELKRAKLSRHRMSELKEFCRQYGEWKQRLKALHPSPGDEVSELAVMRATLQEKIHLVEDTAAEVCREYPALTKYLMKSVTEGMSCDMLMARGMPCGSGMFYRIRREFFTLLSTKR